MRKTFSLFLSFFITHCIWGQPNIDSLRHEVSRTDDDEVKLKSLVRLTSHYKWTIPDSSIYFAMQGLPLAKKLRAEEEEQLLYFYLGEALSGKGNFAFALEAQLKGLKLAEKRGELEKICWSIAGVGSVYFYSHDYENALHYYKKLKNYPGIYLDYEMFFSAFIGEAYFHLGQIDSAFLYINHSYELNKKDPWWAVPQYYMGKILAAKNQYVKALDFYRAGIAIEGESLGKIEGYNGIAELFNQMNMNDSAIYYASVSLAMAKQRSFSNKAIESSAVLKEVYKKMGHTDSAFKYQEIMLEAKDSVYSQEKVKQMQSLAFNELLKEQEMTAEREAYNSRIKIYGLIAAGALFLLITLILLRNNRIKQKAFSLLRQQKDKTEKALQELKTTQSQLIQSEKMASLGELTAGIAHEIQNPLNFVNNFSEVNKELLAEMKDELDKGNFREAKIIANDVIENQEKINHHGKRADAIVKGMLQHSRTSSGQKESTDINALADEYLRLAYHGLRAKDKSFNAKFETDFDESVEKINVMPQDIGRVLLNLINNAFYSVKEKQQQNIPGYQPTVRITTEKTGDMVEIRIIDNGNGVPQHVLDKIFHPFFTTKPTGQGTGLGLSLSYDIIKAHGGNIRVETKEAAFAQFIVQLPTS